MIFKTLWWIARYRYATKEQIAKFEKSSVKIATRPVLGALAESGFIGFNEQTGAYYQIPQTIAVLKERETKESLNRSGIYYNTGLLFKADGAGRDHELAITEYLLSLRDKPFFFDFGFPTFSSFNLNPDALVIYLNKIDKKFKLEFIEIECADHGTQYIKDKMAKYDTLARWENMWGVWWVAHKELYGAPACSVNDFCFEVRVI